MVDVTGKDATLRTAIARATVYMQPETLQKIINKRVKKGNVLETARIAGIMAAKKSAELIPMCHPLNITHVSVDFALDEESHMIQIEAGVRLVGQTGVEMEALSAVAIAALTVYDMCKSYDREMIINDIHLAEKTGGKSGRFKKKSV
jgi:cyclic pyranopterin phosphate synthase